MRVVISVVSLAVGMLVGTALAEASEPSINLTGQYRCVQICRFGLVGNPAYITQNGSDLNLLNEAGEPSRAWFDWFAPKIVAENWHEGAVYSPDGMTIQFDHGTIWQRDLGPPPVIMAPRRR